MAQMSRARSAREARRVSQFGKFRMTSLNLVPLVDTFVALVFFMLLTATSATVPVASGVQLPEVTTGDDAVEQVTVGIGSRPAQVTLNGQQIMTVQQAALAESPDPSRPLVIPQLEAALRQAADSLRRERNLAPDARVDDLLAVHGDRAMRYDLLARVIQTARAAGFNRITLQVRRSATAASGAPQAD
jgi:biopolymer transport protein ExbD